MNKVLNLDRRLVVRLPEEGRGPRLGYHNEKVAMPSVTLSILVYEQLLSKIMDVPCAIVERFYITHIKLQTVPEHCLY